MARQPFESGTPDVNNCLLGDKGRCRNVPLCKDRRTCKGCGWDRDEYIRRIALLRNKGMQNVTPARMSILRHNYGVDPRINLKGLRVGRKTI